METRIGYRPDHRGMGRMLMDKGIGNRAALPYAKGIERLARTKAQNHRVTGDYIGNFSIVPSVTIRVPFKGGNRRIGAIVVNKSKYAAVLEVGRRKTAKGGGARPYKFITKAADQVLGHNRGGGE